MTTAKWEEAWMERLAFLGPGKVVLITWPDSKALKIQAFGDSKMARGLVGRFGGKAVRARLWRNDALKPRAPLNIRGKLSVYADEAEWRASADGRRRTAILVPLGMAFGSGEHATTASCLRFLCDLLPGLPDGWSLLDAGTGSGILAAAAERLGAGSVDALDCDPVCVRAAKSNARKNRCRRIRVIRGDILDWAPGRRYHVITANLFSDLLIAAAVSLQRAMEPCGVLVFSGVLAHQIEEVVTALENAGFAIMRTIRRGKWAAGVCKKAC